MTFKFEPGMKGTPPWKCENCNKRFRKKSIAYNHNCKGVKK